MYRMRVVTRALSMASMVSGRPGPVPGAGGNCANANGEEAKVRRNKNQAKRELLKDPPAKTS
jgi:hypothetical protein